MYWIIATDLGARSKIKELIFVLKDQKQKIEEVSLAQILNPDYIPNFPNNENSFFYGPVNFIKRMSMFNKYPGVIGSDSFLLEKILNNVPGEYLLNNKETTFIGKTNEIKEFVKNKTNNLYFFKPGNDDKLFSGGVYNINDILNICSNIELEKLPDANKDIPLVIGELYGIEAEYRFFIINHKIATYSQYARNQQYFTSQSIPTEVINFANKMINIWSPEEAYVLDIGLSNNHPYVIEYQGINSAGLYDANLKDYVSACIKLWG